MKAFIKPFEAPQRSVKIKIKVNFFFLPGTGTLRVKKRICNFPLLSVLQFRAKKK